MNLVLATSLYSQVTFLPKIGVSWSSVIAKETVSNQFVDDFDYRRKGGLVIGIATDIPLGGHRFSLQPEILFHQKGYTSIYSLGPASSTTRLNYLEVPVLIRVNFGKFYATTGTYVGFGIGGNFKRSYSYMGQTEEYEGKVKFGADPYGYQTSKQYFNAVDFGVQFGTGMNLSVVVVDLRFGLGLTDIIERQDFDAKTLNTSLQLTVGYPLVAKK